MNVRPPPITTMAAHRGILVRRLDRRADSFGHPGLNAFTGGLAIVDDRDIALTGQSYKLAHGRQPVYRRGGEAVKRPSVGTSFRAPGIYCKSTMREAVVVASSRTGLAKSYRGSFNMTRPDDLAAHCIRDVLRKAPQLDPSRNRGRDPRLRPAARPAGQNVARVAAMLAGLPVTVAATTVNRFCSSGLQAIAMAAHQIIHEGVGRGHRRRRREHLHGAAR